MALSCPQVCYLLADFDDQDQIELVIKSCFSYYSLAPFLKPIFTKFGVQILK